jgi:hypothetical protein
MSGGRVINVSGKTAEEIFTPTNPGYVNTAAGGNTQVVNEDGSTNVVVTGSIVAAGKATASTTDGTITANYNNISVINDGPNELILAINESSVSGTKKIYIAPGEAFDKAISGTSLHHSVASGSAVFRYALG